MGFLDNILKTGLRAAERAVTRAVNDAVYDNVHGTVDKGLRNGMSKTDEAISKSVNIPSSKANTSSTVTQSTDDAYDGRTFAQKLPEVLKKIGEFEIKENISADSIEAEAGRELYKRGGCYRLPQDITYAIYKEGQRVLFINVYDSYKVYVHQANYKIREYCNEEGTPMMDFFDYMTNDVDYMEDRIRKAIG
ncbi:MAG: hypothetical protein IKK33_04710 [Lachnospiraceae bacterium]|nr:hypothetical protein [Lachnospiraceae bacterium]